MRGRWPSSDSLAFGDEDRTNEADMPQQASLARGSQIQCHQLVVWVILTATATKTAQYIASNGPSTQPRRLTISLTEPDEGWYASDPVNETSKAQDKKDRFVNIRPMSRHSILDWIPPEYSGHDERKHVWDEEQTGELRSRCR